MSVIYVLCRPCMLFVKKNACHGDSVVSFLCAYYAVVLSIMASTLVQKCE